MSAAEQVVATPQEAWNLGLLAEFWERDLPRVNVDGPGFFAGFSGMANGPGAVPGTHYVLAFAKCVPDACADEIRRMQAVFGTEPGEGPLAEILATHEGNMRWMRSSDRQIPETVAEWYLDGGDGTNPLQREWRWLKQANVEGLAPLMEKVRATQPSITALAAPGRIDAKTLSEFGTLRRVPASDVLTP